MYIKLYKVNEFQGHICSKSTYQVVLWEIPIITSDDFVRNVIKPYKGILMKDSQGRNIIKFQVSGKTKCNPKDTFNAEKGRDQAENKAIKKGYHHASVILKAIMRKSLTDINRINDFNTEIVHKGYNRLQYDLE